MRTVTLPIETVASYIARPRGVALEMSVVVGWPELQLTPGQHWANAMADWRLAQRPYEDHAIFVVRFEWPKDAGGR